MNEVSLGPVVLSGPRFGVALALIALLVTAEIVERRGRRGVAPASWNAVVVGLVAARLGYVLLHLGTYAARPLSVLYVWQGGFELWAGVAAAAAFAVIALRGRAAVLRAALLAGLVGAAVWGGWQLASGPAPAASPKLLTASIRGLDGTSTDVKAFVGKPLVVNLWATWCPPCRRELPMLAKTAAATPGVTFVFVSQGEPEARVASYLREHHLDLQHVYLDTGSRLSAAVASRGLPTTLFFDGNGKLVGRWLGELSPAKLGDELGRIR